jgi:hypothetical protein
MYHVVEGSDAPLSSEAPIPLVPQVMKRSAAIGTSDSTMMATAADRPSTALIDTDWRCRGASVNRCETTAPDSRRSASATCAVSVVLRLSTATDVSK